MEDNKIMLVFIYKSNIIAKSSTPIHYVVGNKERVSCHMVKKGVFLYVPTMLLEELLGSTLGQN